MKFNYKFLQLTIICTGILLFIPAFIFAQPPGFTPHVVDAPIDGGLSLLVAAGIGYGSKKIRMKRKK